MKPLGFAFRFFFFSALVEEFWHKVWLGEGIEWRLKCWHLFNFSCSKSCPVVREISGFKLSTSKLGF